MQWLNQSDVQKCSHVSHPASSVLVWDKGNQPCWPSSQIQNQPLANTLESRGWTFFKSYTSEVCISLGTASEKSFSEKYLYNSLVSCEMDWTYKENNGTAVLLLAIHPAILKANIKFNLPIRLKSKSRRQTSIKTPLRLFTAIYIHSIHLVKLLGPDLENWCIHNITIWKHSQQQWQLFQGCFQLCFNATLCLGYVTGLGLAVQEGSLQKMYALPTVITLWWLSNLFVCQTDVEDGFINPLKHHELKEVYGKSSSPATSWSPPAWSGCFSKIRFLLCSLTWVTPLGCIMLFFHMVSLETQADVEFSNDFKMPEMYDLWGSISTLHHVLEWCYVQHDKIVKMTSPMQDERTMNKKIYIDIYIYIHIDTQYLIWTCTSCMSTILNMQNHGRKKPCL